jgi:hypothetical protein
MTDETTIINLLDTLLNPEALLLGTDPAKYGVEEHEPPLTLQKKYLTNGVYDLLFTVECEHVTSKRVLQNVPHTLEGHYNVNVWLADKYNTNPQVYNALRNAAVAEIQRIFKANPEYGTTVDTKKDDHFVGTVKIYNTTVHVKNETDQ